MGFFGITPLPNFFAQQNWWHLILSKINELQEAKNMWSMVLNFVQKISPEFHPCPGIFIAFSGPILTIFGTQKVRKNESMRCVAPVVYIFKFIS